MPLPIITEADDLLLMLRDDPRRRAVAYGIIADAPRRPCVCEYPGEHVEGVGRILAVIESGSADDLLHAATKADVERDHAAWAACPIRCHPCTWSTFWVLPEHPEASNAPLPPQPDFGTVRRG